VNFKQKVYIWFTIALKIWNLIEYYHRKNILNIFIYLYVSFKKITWTCPNSHGNFLIAAQFFAVQSSSSWSCWFQFCSYSGRAVIVYVRELQISSVELRTFRCSFVPQKMPKNGQPSLDWAFRISDFRLLSVQSLVDAFMRCSYLSNRFPAIFDQLGTSTPAFSHHPLAEIGLSRLHWSLGNA